MNWVTVLTGNPRKKQYLEIWKFSFNSIKEGIAKSTATLKGGREKLVCVSINICLIIMNELGGGLQRESQMDWSPVASLMVMS